MQRFIDRFEIGEAARTVQDFIWNEYCDWYIEAAKNRLYGKEGEEAKRTAQYVLYKGLEGALALLHPFMPFLTEEIWQMLPGTRQALICSSLPPSDSGQKAPDAEAEMGSVIEIIRTIRNIKAEFGVASNKKVDAIFQAEEPALSPVSRNEGLIRMLAGVDKLTMLSPTQGKPKKAAAGVASGIGVFLPLEGMIDVSREIERLSKEVANLTNELSGISAKLSNESFLKKAPQAVVERERTRASEIEEASGKLKLRIKELS